MEEEGKRFVDGGVWVLNGVVYGLVVLNFWLLWGLSFRGGGGNLGGLVCEALGYMVSGVLGFFGVVLSQIGWQLADGGSRWLVWVTGVGMVLSILVLVWGAVSFFLR